MKITRDLLRQLITEELDALLAEETMQQQRDNAIDQISNILVSLTKTQINAQDVMNKAKEKFEKYRKSEERGAEPSQTQSPLPGIGERKLTKAEEDKKEEIAKAMEEEDPDIDMSKKMAIATAQAKRSA